MLTVSLELIKSDSMIWNGKVSIDFQEEKNVR